MRGARGRRVAGFTLLEIMIAVAILSAALTWLVVGVSRNIKAENHAKLMTTATFLAREKMVDVEDELYDKGFGEFEKEQSGSFDDKGFARFSWRAIVDKVELPSQEQVQTVLANAQQAKQSLAGGSTEEGLAAQAGGGSGGSASSPLSAGAGMLGSSFGIIKDVLENGIRRVTIRILWTEGRTPQQVELIAYFTDVRRVDQSLGPGGLAAPPTGNPPTGNPPSGPGR